MRETISLFVARENWNCFALYVKVFELNGAVLICKRFQLSLGKVYTIFGTVGQEWIEKDGPGNGPETKVIARIL